MDGPGDILRAAAARFGGKTALVTASRTLTYAELDALSDRVAAGLVARGVRAGQPVSLYAQNRWEWVVAYHGALKAGAVVNPVNVMLTPEELAFVLRDCGAAAVFHQRRAGPDGPRAHPRAARAAHAVLLNCALTATMHGRREDDVVVTALPTPHVYGNVVINGTFLAGGTVVLMERFAAGEALRLIAEHRATLFEGVPRGCGSRRRRRPRRSGTRCGRCAPRRRPWSWRSRCARTARPSATAPDCRPSW